MIEGIYIADSAKNLVFEHLTSLSSPSFGSLSSLIDLRAGETPTPDEDTLPVISINNDYHVCYQSTKNLVIYTLVSSVATKATNPLIPFTFIARLVEVMEMYFGAPLTVTKIDANNDTLNVLVNEMIDEGVPHVTDANRLRDVVPLKSLLSRILSSTNEAIQSTTNALPLPLDSLTRSHTSSGVAGLPGALQKSNLSASTTDTPWRRTNVKYTNNEMFVDVQETVSVTLKPKRSHYRVGKPVAQQVLTGGLAYYGYTGTIGGVGAEVVAGTIAGQVHFTSHLTGVPDVQLVLDIPPSVSLETPAFHPCVRKDKWQARPGVLSFVPADGEAVLMDYSIDIDSHRRPTDLIGLVQVLFQTELGTRANEFELRLHITQQPGVAKVEDLEVRVHTREATRSMRCTHGEFVYKGSGLAVWTIRNVSTGVSPMLRAVISDEDDEDAETREAEQNDADRTERTAKAPSYLTLSYTYKGSLASGIKVGSLKLVSARGMGDNVKPYKGVKYMTLAGEFVIRA